MMIPLVFREACSNLWAFKLRSSLAILGILIGIASVLTMVSCAEMATEKALEHFKSLGTHLMAVSVYDRVRQHSNSIDTALTLEQVVNLADHMPSILKSIPYVLQYQPIRVKGHHLDSQVVGVMADLKDILKINIFSGRFISDLDGYHRFAVVGHNLYEKMHTLGLFDPVGQQVQVGQQMVTVIGVLKPWPENHFFSANINEALLVPIQFILSTHHPINHVMMTLREGASIDQTEASVRQLLKTNGSKKAFFFRSAKQMIETMKKQHRIYTLLLGLIASISLFVGGIGVMNIMLVSVAERRREIGVRKAIGARQSDIQYLFLSESIVLSLFGGALGVLFGVVISATVAQLADWDFAIHGLWTCVSVSFAVGVFFGWYPARQAAKLDPIVCLRMD